MSFVKYKLPKSIYLLHAVLVPFTFGYAVLYSSLIIYLTRYQQFSLSHASSMVGLFIALNFSLHLLSGYIGKRLISNRLLIVLCICFKTLGLFLLSFPGMLFLYLGLSLFLIGAGIGVTCYNCIFIDQFPVDCDESMRETAFFHNYCAMNVGFFLGFLVSGYFDLKGNYASLLHWTNASNLLSLVLIGLCWPYLQEKNSPLANGSKKRVSLYQCSGLAALMLLIPIVVIAFKKADLANNLVLVSGILVLLYITMQAKNLPVVVEKNKMIAYLIFTLASIVFWMLTSMGPIGITHFIKYNVDKSLWGYPIAVQWITNLNAIFVIISAPLLAILFTQMRRRGFVISIPKQFYTSMIALALSFFCLSWAVSYADALGQVHVMWLVLHYLTQSIGELLIAPVGFAMISTLAPAHLQGIMMGLWLMVPGIAASLSQYLSNSMISSDSLDPLISNPEYFLAFNQYGIASLIVACVMMALASKIEAYMGNEALELQTESQS